MFYNKLIMLMVRLDAALLAVQLNVQLMARGVVSDSDAFESH